MVLFRDEEQLEQRELEKALKSDAVIRALVKQGEQKTEEPLHRNRKLKDWPSESAKRKIFGEVLAEVNGLPPRTRSIEPAELSAYKSNVPNEEGKLTHPTKSVEQWKARQSQTLWEEITKDMAEPEKERVIEEFAIHHVSQILSNTIHLEALYTSLKPLGEKQWELASVEIKNGYLSSIGEGKPSDATIPDWVKGVILYLALQGGRHGSEVLKERSRTIPEPKSMKAAADWCLGPQITPSKKESTSIQLPGFQAFEEWNNIRIQSQLELVHLPLEEIHAQNPAKPALEGECELPWILAWRIPPTPDKSVRALGSNLMKDVLFNQKITMIFKKRLFERWCIGVCRRAYIRKFEGSRTIADRWQTCSLILNPINNYIPTRFDAKNQELRLLAKTESAWTILTGELPEPEFQ
jgi:hypothetical protein